MGKQVVETIYFDGYAAFITTKSFGVEEWNGKPVRITSTTHSIDRMDSVAYLLPKTSSNLGRKILGAELQLWAHTATNGTEQATMATAPLVEKMTSASIAGDAPPPATGNKYLSTFPGRDLTGAGIVSQTFTSIEDCRLIYENGFRVSPEDLPAGAYAMFNSPGQGGQPTFLLNVEYLEPEVFGFGPAGWINVKKDTRFYWSMRYDTTDAIGTISQAAAKFQWKDGEGGTVHEVSLTTETEYTVPANTFPESGNLLWRVILTADNGESSSNMEWTKLSAFDSIPVLTPVSPVGEYIDASKRVRFEWAYSIDTGSKQTAYEVQVKGASDWETIASGTGDASSVEVLSDLIPSGTIQWRVRGANFDGVFSDWSVPATFVAIAAPKKPSVSVVSATPRPEISWQGAGQQGYEAQIGSYKTGVVYGTKKQVKSKIHLPDGKTVARVRIVNEFGLWSEWAEVEFEIANNPLDGSILLRVQGGKDALLSWNVLTSASAYQVFRNGKLIATTKNGSYKDSLCVGSVSYFVRAIQYLTDNYLDSKRVAVTVATDHVLIAPLGGEWIDLEYALTATPSVQTTTNSEVSLMRYYGRAYPMPEYSPHKSRIYRINVAFSDRAEANRFEALMGGLVAVKDQYGNFMVGVIESVQKTQSAFFTSFAATVSQVDEAAYENN